jgi:hypothetical protein
MDRAGNSARDAAYLFVDKITPFFGAVAPYITEEQNAAVAIYANDFGSDTLSFTYSVNGGPEQASGAMIGVPSSAPFSPIPWLFGNTISVPVSNGVNTVVITARDLSGNQSTRTVSVLRGQAPVAMVSLGRH